MPRYVVVDPPFTSLRFIFSLEGLVFIFVVIPILRACTAPYFTPEYQQKLNIEQTQRWCYYRDRNHSRAVPLIESEWEECRVIAEAKHPIEDYLHFAD